MTKLTIFTPTFQRAQTLPRLYESLVGQDEQDFVWHVVDDGSTDNTAALVRGWEAKAPFPIRYTYQANGGKARAHNVAVEACETPYFMCLDSDDYLVRDAVSSILAGLGHCHDESCGGLIAYKGLSEWKPLTSARFSDLTHVTLGGEYRRGFSGDTTLAYRTPVIRQHLFPTYPGETFVTENYVYAQIDASHTLHVLRKIMIVCEYQNDGLSNSPLRLKRDNPLGWREYHRLLSRIESAMIRKAYHLAQSLCYHILAGERTRDYRANRLAVIAISPAGFCLAAKRRRQYRELEVRDDAPDS